MATYKKKYKPEGKKEEQQVEEMESTTAEVFNTLDETASKSEQWIEKNSKPLFTALIAVVVIFLAFLGYNKYISEPNELEASNELAFPRKYFDEAATATKAVNNSLLLFSIHSSELLAVSSKVLNTSAVVLSISSTCCCSALF